MNDQILQSADDERYRATTLIRRLLTEQGLVHWKKYAVAFTLMAISAACTALSAYLIGDVINQAYVNRNLPGIVILGGITAALFAVKGVATYGHSVMLSHIGNRIIANTQRAVFAKLLSEGLRFFSDRHSSELMARLAMAANGARDAVQFVINSAGRDVLTVVGLAGVMVYNDPLMSLIALSIAPVGVLMLSRLMKKVRRAARRKPRR